MERRAFLLGMGGLIAGQFLLSGAGGAYAQGGNNNQQSPDHPFSGLVDMKTGQPYCPSSDKFSLALFMTQQQSYPSCGGAFIGVYQGITLLNAGNQIEPVIIMPRATEQSDPDDRRNLSRAEQMGFKILTGDLEEIQRAAKQLGTAFETNDKGQVSGHSLDAFFLTPSGQKLFQHYAEDQFGMMSRIESFLERCVAERKQLKQCL